MERRSHDWKFGWRLVFAPTRALFDSRWMKKRRRWDIKKWSKTFLLINGLLLFLLKPLWTVRLWSWMWMFVALALYVVPFSRVVEIFYAFYYDALEKIDYGSDGSSSLKRGDRFRLVGVSYIEVSICFATLYRAMPGSWFISPDQGVHSRWPLGPFDWFYFSWVTITTTGYGDFFPTHPPAREAARYRGACHGSHLDRVCSRLLFRLQRWVS
jgi:hypothetical protein